MESKNFNGEVPDALRVRLEASDGFVECDARLQRKANGHDTARRGPDDLAHCVVPARTMAASNVRGW
jgi:hypothetical protein